MTIRGIRDLFTLLAGICDRILRDPATISAGLPRKKVMGAVPLAAVTLNPEK
jgi:hypothetical protein